MTSTRSSLLLVSYWLPVALGWSVALALQRSHGGAFSPEGLALLLGGIGCAYSLDRLLDASGEAQPEGARRMLIAGAVLGGGVALWGVVRLPVTLIAIAVALGMVTLAYRYIKRLPLLKNVLVAGIWLMAVALFPFGSAERLPEGWLLGALGLLFLTSSLLCDLKDEEEDRARSVPTLPNLCGAAWTCRIATVLALSAAVLAWSHGRVGLMAAGGLMALVAQFPAFLRQPALGPIIVDAALLVPVLVAAITP